MIENRELTMDDYLAMLRRRMKVILIPALIAPVAGFLISYAFTPKYTSQSLVLVEEQKVPEGYVKPVVTEDITQRIATMQQQVLSRNRLQPMIEKLQLKGKSLDDMVDEIRQNVTVTPVQPDITSAQRRRGQSEVPGFYVNFTADNPREAQQVCSELTSMMLEENLKAREQVAQGTTEFLSRQVDEAKHNLDELDSKLAVFKRQYMGQLPGDEDQNLKLLMGLNSQLDASTQALNRAQQDRTYTQSLLSQQVAAWKSSQNETNPTSLEQQLTALQSQLISLTARYTEDHPDVIKTKADIAEIKRKIDEMNKAAAANSENTEKAGVAEPAEIRQLRLQIHQYDQTIAEASREQKRIKDQIAIYQGRVALSPAIEEQYKGLTRDYDTALKFYNDLLAKRSESEMQTDMERRQQGEQMRLLNPANLPDTPSFPVRWLFAAGGLGGGLALGMGLALWIELRDKAIRTEKDVEAVMELPTLVSVPWLGPEFVGKADRYGSRSSTDEPKKETVEV
ncbi:MAG TPA: Wzz/FepE/Etk N-terminal domain-containing protein [Terriglobales bacterium]|nr:Wzz/FepE/Etk N-terminal domain-containing protein [Terriglobales bacterium]